MSFEWIEGGITPNSIPVFAVSNDTDDGKFLAGWKDYGSVLSEYAGQDPRGLILFTGGTGSGKTEALNAVLWHFLKGVASKMALPKDIQPGPAVVSVGDPPETWLYPEKQEDGRPKKRVPAKLGEWMKSEPGLPFRFMARTIGTDVESVEMATRDALRETPKAFIISELRNKPDFAAALRFAGTGHFVLATSHATSIVDAMAQLVSYSKAKTAHGRALLASRVRMLVHLSPEKVGGTNALFMRTWRNTPQGIRAFMADGLAALQIPAANHGLFSYGHALRSLRKVVVPNFQNVDSETKQRWLETEKQADHKDLHPV